MGYEKTMRAAHDAMRADVERTYAWARDNHDPSDPQQVDAVGDLRGDVKLTLGEKDRYAPGLIVLAAETSNPGSLTDMYPIEDCVEIEPYLDGDRHGIPAWVRYRAGEGAVAKRLREIAAADANLIDLD